MGTGAGSGELRVAVVHDYLTQRGGAERVVLELLRAFPGARLFTSIYEPSTTFPDFAEHEVETSWLNRVPAFRADPRKAFPLLASVFARRRLDDVDVVVCSSSGWAHGVGTTARKVVYCHNPPRWVHQQEQYLDDQTLPVKLVTRSLTPYLRGADRRAAASAHIYLANSRAVAERVEQAYKRPARVLPPPVSLDPEGPQQPVPGIAPGFLLTVSRSRGYKNTELVCQAVQALPGARLVVVGALVEGTVSERVQVVTDASDAEMRWLYAHCRAVVSASHEDFGLTPVEGYSFGRPAVCLRAGGFLDTMLPGVTGAFIEDLTRAAVMHALQAVESMTFDAERIRTHAAGFAPSAFRAAVREIAQAEAHRPGRAAPEF